MIGVFDSGVGGLSILKEFLIELPEYNYIYFGDNKNAPFGDLSSDEIYSNTCQALDFLFSKGCEIVIIACNTISAKALKKIQQKYLVNNYPDKKVLGIIIPIIESLDNLEKNDTIGIIATNVTINSGVYNNEFRKANIKNILISKATPQLVPLIEDYNTHISDLRSCLLEIFSEFEEKKINHLILGCTHYLLIADEIEKIITKNITVVNVPKEVTRRLKKYLQKHSNFEKTLKQELKLEVYKSMENMKEAQILYKKYFKNVSYSMVRNLTL